MAADHHRLAVVLVSWNARDYLEKCLTSWYQYAGDLAAHVFVVDNDSVDGSVAMVKRCFPQVHILSNSENVGFARACNQGIQSSSSEYILLLNSDCELTDRCITPLLQGMDQNPQIGVAGPILLHSNGAVQRAGGERVSLSRLFKEQLLFRSASCGIRSIEEIRRRHGAAYFDTGFVSGACMMIRRSMLSRTGLLREDFFMYGEDVEFCSRAKKNGFKTVIFSNAWIVHHKGQSAVKNLEPALRASVTNHVRLIAEQQGRAAAIPALVIYFFGSFMRLLLSCLRLDTRCRAWFHLLVHYHRIIKTVAEKI
ncbi:MAG TPA: glycosyltransferase family 2 protein [bacterium]|nr:glycosyltransferase family 2 protein [bacterium]HPN34626.1 glycosyltransferase family 2 protein [bacterium]